MVTQGQGTVHTGSTFLLLFFHISFALFSLFNIEDIVGTPYDITASQSFYNNLSDLHTLYSLH